MDKTGYKILVVDDEEDICDFLTHFLQKRFKVEVSTSGNGTKAVEMVRALKPDLVLLDMHLPGHMGWEVLKEVRSFDETVKILVVTALYVIPPENEEFILRQTSGYMTKPLNLEDLAGKIIEMMGPGIVR